MLINAEPVIRIIHIYEIDIKSKRPKSVLSQVLFENQFNLGVELYIHLYNKFIPTYTKKT